LNYNFNIVCLFCGTLLFSHAHFTNSNRKKEVAPEAKAGVLLGDMKKIAEQKKEKQ